MSDFIEGVILVGLGTVLVVQTIRGKIPWGKIWKTISQPKTEEEI